MFGRRFPRRWSLYFRIVAGLALVLFLAWWFTRDVTYVSNVKVSGLDATQESYRAPLRTIAADMAALVNRLAEQGYAWEPGGLPSLRADGSLSAEERKRAVALGTLRVKAGKSLASGEEAASAARFLQGRGWSLPTPVLKGSFRQVGPLRATIEVSAAERGAEGLTVVVTAH